MNIESKKDSITDLILGTGAGIICIGANSTIATLTGWDTLAIFAFGVVVTTTCGNMIRNSIKQKRSKWNKLFRNCNIKNKDDAMPRLIKKSIKSNTQEYMFSIPYGISEDDFEKKRLAIECALKSEVDVRRSRSTVIISTDLECEW